ncbi:hypothetical protein [Egicoccus halophilus]|uniref:Alpha/beta hydrolase n=1 Tax=Egicoccus halophilus TaxID=1670830 RepID=A0A8J3A7B1_9ACTN|nr:hypothetical protein [Egicoccus halophilus]GGI05516.1 hypothetical protein GCM10011354_14490 [Egicoccus halophilus]
MARRDEVRRLALARPGTTERIGGSDHLPQWRAPVRLVRRYLAESSG